MGRRPLTDDEKAKRLLAKLAEKTGKTYSEPDSAAKAESSRQAEAVADLIVRPEKYKIKKCGYCNRAFAVNYSSVAYCEDSCRKAHLRRQGILWHPDKTAEERWGWSGVPLVVPPDALHALRLALNAEPIADAARL